MSDITIALVRYQTLNYQFDFSTSSGYTFIGWCGRLPSGLSVSSTGITGQVNDMSDTYDIIVDYLTGAANHPTSVEFVLTDANPLNPPVISCSSVIVNNGVNTVTSQAGTVSIQFAASNTGGNWTGSFPYGLSINSYGLLSGTLAPGTYSIVVQASNSAWWSPNYGTGPTQTATYIVALTVTPAIPVVTMSSSYFGGNFTVGDEMPNSTICSVQDYAKPVTWSATGLPDGVAINPTSGYVTGKLTAEGSFNVTITATNSAGSGSFRQQLIVQANQNVPVVSLATEQPGYSTSASGYNTQTLSFVVGQAVTIYLNATNTPTSWAAADLPSGLTIDAQTGIVSGILRAAGSYRFFVTATNSVGDSLALAVTVTATGAAQAFEFVAADPTLMDLQIDVRSGAVSSSRTSGFKQYQQARFALVFLDLGVPVAPPDATTVKMGIRPKDQFEADYLFPLPPATLVPAADGQPAYLLVVVPINGDDLTAELKKLLDAGTTTPLNVMTDVIWKTNGVQCASQTFNFTISPAVTY